MKSSGIPLVRQVLHGAAAHIVLVGMLAGAASEARDVPARKGQITGLVVAARDDGRGDDQLLLTVPSRVAGKPVDGMTVRAGKARSFRHARPVVLPDGWEMSLEGRSIHLQGPPLQAGEPAPVRIALGGERAPERVRVSVTSHGAVITEGSFGVHRLPPIRPPGKPGDLLDLPEIVSAGDTITFTVPGSGLGLPPGELRIGGRLAYPLETWNGEGSGEEHSGAESGRQAGHSGGGAENEAAFDGDFRYTVTLGYDLDPGLGISLKYTSYWDEPVIEDDEIDDVVVVPQPALDPVLPRITACTAQSFAGEKVCVCGWFPDQDSRSALTLDGTPLGPAVSSSNRIVTVRLPSELSPGTHVISGAGIRGSANITILEVGGSVNQDLLHNGQSTPIRLWVLGTDEPVDLRLTNHTPGVVSLRGGNDQVVTTSGGSGNENAWEGVLDAISPGDFKLDYELTVGGCPCSEDEVIAEEDLPPPDTPYGEALDSLRRARKDANDARYGGLPPAEARDRAQRALDEFENTRRRIEEGAEVWTHGDLEGGIGPTTEETLRRLIALYEGQARGVLESTPEATTGTSVTASGGTLGGSTTAGEPDGDDPRDTPPPVAYGEEADDQRIGVLLFRNDPNWVPEYGNRTTVTAKIYRPDPARRRVWLPSATRTAMIRVFFVHRSREKGQDLNTPLDSERQDTPDVFFDQTRNPGTRCDADPVGSGYFGSCVTLSEVNEYTFTISSEDYGAFSTLDVSCLGCVSLAGVVGMESGGYPVAVEEPERARRLVHVPKDVNKNQISDGYPPDRLWAVAAEEDDDNVPVGNGIKGDGLSAYEEYRGFHNRQRQHIRTSWNTKDLFVQNPMGFVVGGFAQASGIHVHEVASDQFRDRVVNFNSGHAHVVEQHGLVMLPRYTPRKGLLGEVTDFGPPKNVEEVKIYLLNMYHYRSSDRMRGLQLDETVAHELGHAVGIRHHGDTSTWKETWYPPGGWSELSPLHNTYTRPILCGVRLPGEVLFGRKHNQSSGVLDCYMRYKGWGAAFEQEDGTIDCAGRSPAQHVFCDSSAGSGWNAGNRAAGDAAVGDCTSQIQVNDGT